MKRSFSLLVAFLVIISAMSAASPLLAHEPQSLAPNHKVERCNPKNNKKVYARKKYNGKQKAYKDRKKA